MLSAGRLLQVADPATLWRRPAGREVAEFLGYGPFLDVSAAAGLGWTGPPGEVGIGPAGLVPDVTGTELAVVEVRARRGGSEITVRLPDGRLARVRTPDIPAHGRAPATLAVRLDTAGCVVLGGPAGGVVS